MTEALGASTLTIPTDISQQADVDKMVQQTVERFGTVDILVNNAAILGWDRYKIMMLDRGFKRSM